MHQLEAGGYKPILYCSLSYYRDVLGSPTRWPLWLAYYGAQMPTALPPELVVFAWQRTDKGTCPGVSQPCDMNRVFYSSEGLKKFMIP
jgi:GH25 family lysozyme M1 (1,4-beta-N-acetylmuramidase)